MAMFHINRIRNKTGQSLVEVMVALFALIIVFVGMATLIIQSLNLVMFSRTRTEVVALAQRTMDAATLQVKSSCPALAINDGMPLGVTFPDVNSKYQIEARAYTLSPADQPTGIPVGVSLPANIYKVKVTVTWKDKGSVADSTYNLTELVSQ